MYPNFFATKEIHWSDYLKSLVDPDHKRFIDFIIDHDLLDKYFEKYAGSKSPGRVYVYEIEEKIFINGLSKIIRFIKIGYNSSGRDKKRLLELKKDFGLNCKFKLLFDVYSENAYVLEKSLHRILKDAGLGRKTFKANGTKSIESYKYKDLGLIEKIFDYCYNYL
jgi:hypothetical protein